MGRINILIYTPKVHHLNLIMMTTRSAQTEGYSTIQPACTFQKCQGHERLEKQNKQTKKVE